ncbi:hypothetical protein MTR67_038709 [Solanum verrucosum]|uniref:Uncharacterized protein n=1 Tax=Solanum verrucosum TaxID=315347 RepID=A0AAF0UGB2_SOLVR|nr:hypothetical protein MTR67_038709 [Solanum verrucosum]
MSVRKASQN